MHKNFPIGLHVMDLYFPDTPRIFPELTEETKEHDKIPQIL